MGEYLGKWKILEQWNLYEENSFSENKVETARKELSAYL